MSLPLESVSSAWWQRRYNFPLFVLAFFTLLTLIFTRPLVAHLSSLSLGGDALVNLRILEWGKASLLGGPQALLNLPHGNILYPYRYTLFFSEHLLPITALVLPGLVILPGPLAALNLYTLVTFVLTGFGIWLLLTYWTRNRWVGLLAGVIVAFASPRLSIVDQPNILTIQWIPLAVLTLHRWLERGNRQDWWLALLFINLQTLSATNYLVHVFFMLALLCSLYVVIYRDDRLTCRKVPGLLALGLAVGLINAPVWWTYFRVSAILGIERDAGAVRLGSAHVLNYLMATPDNLIYGTLASRLAKLTTSALDIPAVFPLFPGFVSLLLAWIALAQLPRSWSRRQRLILLTLLAWLLVGFFLSLGLNDYAFGPRLASYLQPLLPYRWLYDHVPGFKGLRVPARFAVLVLLSLGALAAYGVLTLQSRDVRLRTKLYPFVSIALICLVSAELITLPLDGDRYPYGANIPPIYTWLDSSTPSDSLIVEMPYDAGAYMYYAGFHRRTMVNGASGFSPPPLDDEAANLLHQFPSWASIEWLQRLSIDYVVLHSATYDKIYGPDAWDSLWARLPAYMGSILGVTQIGKDFALELAPSLCHAQPDNIQIDVAVTDSDEPEANEVQALLSFANPTAAGLVFDPNLPSFLTVGNIENGCPGRASDTCRFLFHEPLVLLPGQESHVRVSLKGLRLIPESQVTVVLGNLSRTLRVNSREGSKSDAFTRAASLGDTTTEFTGEARLLGYQLSSDEAISCQVLQVQLDWQPPALSNGREKVTLQLLDRYGWPVIESQAQPWLRATPGNQVASQHHLPIPGPLPAGQYNLNVRLQKPDGTPLLAYTPEGPVESLRLATVVVRPQPPEMDAGEWQPVGASVADVVALVAYRLDRTQVSPGDWLRLTLVWQAQTAPGRDATVFTQLIGPDGQVWAQYDNPPRGGSYPTSLWQPGELVSDDYLLQVKPDTPPGRYTLITGMYLPDTLERLPVQMEGGFPGDTIILTEIDIVIPARGYGSNE